MPTIRQKVEHVLEAKQLRLHHCHWPGCREQVPPAKWGCRKHWYMLPVALRNKIWAAYQPGQEIDGTPSQQYMKVAIEVRDWIKSQQQTIEGT